MSRNTALTRHITRHIIRAIKRGLSGGIGGGGGLSLISAFEPRLYDIDDQEGLDFDLRNTDLYAQFLTAAQTVADFDPALALYYPVTNSFGVEPLPPPVNATQVAVLAVQNGARLGRRQIDGLMSYGGTRQAMHVVAADRIIECDLNASITALPITLICRHKPVTTGLTHPFVSLLQTADNAGNIPRYTLRINSANKWNAVYFKTAALFNGVSSILSFTASEWTTGIAEFTDSGGGVVLPSVWKHNRTLGANLDTDNTGTQTYAGAALTRLSIGLPQATGQTFLPALDEMTEIMVYAGVLTDVQKQAFIEDPAPPWNLLVPDTTKIRAWVSCLNGVMIERTLGKPMRVKIAGTPFTFVDYTGTAAFEIRNHNRLLTQSTSTVLKIPYGSTHSGEIALPAISSALWRAQAHHKLRYDMDTGTADATGAAGTYSTLEAGVGLVYGLGGAVDIDVVNDSGTATDVGTLDLTGIVYDHHYYGGFESGLTWTETDDTVVYTNNTAPNDGEYGVRVYMPDGLADPPVIVHAAGSGGNFDDYLPFARYCAAHGYCVVVLEFQDRSSDTDGGTGPDDYHWQDRIAQYREFLEVHLVATLGFTPTKIVVCGHSGGGFTSLPAVGAKWWYWDGAGGAGGPTRVDNWNNGGRSDWLEHADGLVTVDGDAEIVCAIQISGQGTQLDDTNDLAFRIDVDAWDEIPTTVPVLWLSGTRDDGNDGQEYPWRHEGYELSPTDLPKAKAGYQNGHHQYGNGLSQGDIGVANGLSVSGEYYWYADHGAPNSQKHAEYLKSRLFQDHFIAFCDAACGRGDGIDWIVNQKWKDEPTLFTDYAVRNLTAVESVESETSNMLSWPSSSGAAVYGWELDDGA